MAKETAAVKKGTENKGAASSSKFAVVLVRGLARIPVPIVHTLALLKLIRKNRCIIVEDTPMYRGMLKKVKDYITWGEISEETFVSLVEKRGQPFKGRLQDRKMTYTYKTLEFKGKNYLPYFNLNPPRGGFERKGIKVAYPAGGALGYRGEKMNELLQRMIP